MISRLKYILVGSPLSTQELAHKRLNKVRALAAFAPNGLSSIGYANQEIFLGLVIAGSVGLGLTFPIGIGITSFLAIVALSYYQIIHAYPSGGGSYVLARENLGEKPGLLAGAALLVAYILTAADSLTAGVEAIASAFPSIWGYQVELALFLLVIIVLINLRGAQESGTIMSIPIYLFLGAYGVMLVVGILRVLREGPGSAYQIAPLATEPLSWGLILRAFASGCTALTGIEAISNGVPVFKTPEAKNAGQTLVILAILMGFLFLGSLGLTHYFSVIPNSQETILSAPARRLLDNSPLYYLVQISTLLILAVAENTSFAGFPRVASILSKNGYLPRQLTNLGDRLVV